MEYKYKDKAFTSVKAQVVGDTLNEIFEQNEGVVLTSTVVKAATLKKSPIHGCFEWDNNIAAKKYRETQAGYLLRSIIIVHESCYEGDDKTIEIRAFVSVEGEDGRYYTTIGRAAEDEKVYDNIETEAYNDYMELYHKYKTLKLFRQVNNEIDKIKI